MKTDHLGIATAYEDAFGVVRETTEATRNALAAAMGCDPNARLPKPHVRVIDRRKPSALKLGRGELRLEDGTTMIIADKLPANVPLGYHDFFPVRGKRPIRLIVSPGVCHPPPTELEWGWSAQLYAARSTASWGIGDLGDLRLIARWSRDLQAAFVLINPLPAVDPVSPQEASPYYPTSRRFRNPLYLRIENVPGAAALPAGELEEFARAGHALNLDRRIRRDDVFRLKLAALERIWLQFTSDAEFDAFRREQGAPLVQFATYCVLVEQFGADWSRWDAEYRSPDAPGTQNIAAAHPRRVEFHQWMQWLLDRQLAAISELPVMQDLPIGFSGRGFDAWSWQEELADGVTVGAPPDLYNTQGQNWGFPPWVPHRLQASNYEPFIQTIRAMMRHAGGLRFDHILGLFRLFWIPQGRSPVEGVYVKYPANDLLNIIALESQRAGAFVVGEDLGTVGKNVRRMLAAAQILSYRLLYFQNTPTTKYPKLAMAAVTTHDLPTIAGLWSGSDLAAQESLGLQPDAMAIAVIRDRLRKMARLPEGAAAHEVVQAAYTALARAPSAVITATLEDALAVEERPNMPATTWPWPNWCIALPEPLETLVESPLAAAIASSLANRGSRPTEASAAGTVATS